MNLIFMCLYYSRCIMAGDHKFVFLVRGHVILVAVAYTPESVTQVSHLFHERITSANLL